MIRSKTIHKEEQYLIDAENARNTIKLLDEKRRLEARERRKRSQPRALVHRKVLQFMKDFFSEYDRIPSAAIIQDHFGWKSANAAQTHIDRLAKYGYIERTKYGHYRFPRDIKC